MYATHKQMPALIRKAKGIVVYVSFPHSSFYVEAKKKSLLEHFTMIARENKEWPEVFSYSISDNGCLYLNGTLETKYL